MQTKLREELAQFSGSDAILNWELLQDFDMFPYLEAVTREALRCKAPVTILQRVVSPRLRQIFDAKGS